MRIHSLLGLLVVLTLSCSSLRNTKGPDTEVVAWSSEEGISRLERSAHKIDFFKLANQFESQSNKLVCGPTTSTIVFNTLRLYRTDVKRPVDPTLVDKKLLANLPPGFDPRFDRYTQKTFFNSKTNKIKNEKQLYGKKMNGKSDYGLQLRQLHQMLGAHGLKSTISVVDDKLSDDSIRRELADNLKRPGDYVIVNYARKELGQKGGGHISPLGAYDEESDSFLVLDVNPNTAPWVWVKAEALIRAMRTMDTVENRGYLLVKEG